MTSRANQTTGLTNGRVANWPPKVVFSPKRAFPLSNDILVLLLNQPNTVFSTTTSFHILAVCTVVRIILLLLLRSNDQ